MTDFQRKLHSYVGERAVMAVAHEVGVDPSTFQRWLGGRSPTLRALKTLADGSGVPVAYWADENVAALAPEALDQGTAPAGLADARLGPSAVFEPDAKDPRALVMPDDSMAPVIERGQVVVYDAAVPAEAAGGLVVTRLGKGLTVRRRMALGNGWVYVAADVSLPAATSLEGATEAHPVVAVITRPRRTRSAARDARAGRDQIAAENAPPYGR
jgi:hypothetical protein